MENLNAKQIKKALECCRHSDSDEEYCADCPYRTVKYCAAKISENALALINSQEQRIKELTEENERLRADTIDEFVKMVKEKMREVAIVKRTSLIGTGWIDEIARELKGE